MADHISPPPFPERLAEPMRRSLAGLPAAWPEALATREVEALDAHGMLPLVHHWSRLPQLKSGSIAAAAFEALRLVELRRALDVLGPEGILPLIIKGSALAYQSYPAPELRPRGDTDLFVRENDVPRVRELLLSAGYVERITSGDRHGLRQALFLTTDGHGAEHALDVHWAIANPSAFSEVIGYDDAAGEALSIDEIHPRALGLDRARAMLLACVHRVAHHHATDRVIWLVDMHLLAATFAARDWERLWAIAGERRVVRVVVDSLEAAARTCGTAWVRPAEVPDDEATSVYLHCDVRRGRILLSELRGLHGWRPRLTRMLDLAFPPFAYMQEAFGVRHRILLPLFYGMRGVRGALRLLRRVA